MFFINFICTLMIIDSLYTFILSLAVNLSSGDLILTISSSDLSDLDYGKNWIPPRLDKFLNSQLDNVYCSDIHILRLMALGQPFFPLFTDGMVLDRYHRSYSIKPVLPSFCSFVTCWLSLHFFVVFLQFTSYCNT